MVVENIYGIGVVCGCETDTAKAEEGSGIRRMGLGCPQADACLARLALAHVSGNPHTVHILFILGLFPLSFDSGIDIIS